MLFLSIFSGGSRGGAWGAGGRAPLFWVKIEDLTEGRKAAWASKLKPGPLLSSKSESATDFVDRMVVVHQSIGRSEIQQGTGANFKF